MTKPKSRAQFVPSVGPQQSPNGNRPLPKVQAWCYKCDRPHRHHDGPELSGSALFALERQQAKDAKKENAA